MFLGPGAWSTADATARHFAADEHAITLAKTAQFLTRRNR